MPWDSEHEVLHMEYLPLGTVHHEAVWTEQAAYTVSSLTHYLCMDVPFIHFTNFLNLKKKNEMYISRFDDSLPSFLLW